jgi:hypothetical protein
MGEHAERRKTGEEKVTKLRAERDRIKTLIANESEESAKVGREAQELARDAVGGDRKALSKQTALFVKKDEHDRQIKNLKTAGADIDAKLTEAEAELSRFILSEQLEVANSLTERVPRVAASLSDLVTPVVEQAKACEKLIADILANLHLLGERSRYHRLERSLQTAVLDGVRAALNNSFTAANFPLLDDSPRMRGLDFAGVVMPRISNVRRAFEMTLSSRSGIAVKGRSMFLVKTNIGGLFGLEIISGERISLDLDDPDVTKLISQGAVERIGEGVGA